MPIQFQEKTFLIAEYVEQPSKLSVELQNAGVNVLFLPTIQCFEKTLDELAATIDRLFEFDWLIFPDSKTVDVFIERLTEKQFDLFQLDTVRICAFGETVSDRLRFSQIHADVIPRFVETESILNAISNYIGGDSYFENISFGFLSDESENLKIIDVLRERKSIAEKIVIYRNEISEPKTLSKLRALLNGGAIDGIIFPNPDSIYKFAELFDLNLPKDAKIIAFGDLTSQTLNERRLKANVILKNGNEKTNVENLAGYFSS